jgi:protein ImuB
VDRRACVSVPALPLQLLAAAHPEWRSLPMAVVDADEPTGILLWVNAAAWRARLRPGMRYASALALERRLRAGVVPDTDIASAVRAITAALRLHTPHVEPSAEEPGVFWACANGLESIYTSVEAWARAVLREVRGLGFEVQLACGFTRFGTYALARSLGGIARRAGGSRTLAAHDGSRRLHVCGSEDEERRLVRDVRLERLGIDPGLRDALARLGVETIGDFLALPPDGIRRRFGEEAASLHRRARGETWDPLVPLQPEEPLRRSLLLDDPVSDTGLVLFVVRRLLGELTGMLAAREQAVRGITVTLHRSLRRDAAPLVVAVTAAEPTLDEGVLLDLVRLRLEAALRGERGAVSSRPGSPPRSGSPAGGSFREIEVEVEAAAAGRDQLRLFHERTRRDLRAGERALARLRAELGEDAVVRAVLREGHLPEATYAWEKTGELRAPSPRLVLARPLVRRMYERPLALPPRPFRERDDCWIPPATSARAEARTFDNGSGADAYGRRLARQGDGSGRVHEPAQRALAGDHVLGGNVHGRVDHMTGPYIVSGGWWNREVHREYHYARTEDGEVLWVFYDRHRRRWFLTGKVE